MTTQLLGLFLLLAGLNAGQQDPCSPVYTPYNLNPTVYDFVNFKDAPLVIGLTEGEYDFYLLGGTISTDGLFQGTTDAPVVIVSNSIWPTPASGEIQASATFNFTSQLASGNINSPLGISEDPFYGCAWFGVEDVQDGWQFAVVMTQAKVYGYYSRTSTAVSIAGNYKLFAFLVPFANRTPSMLAAEYSIVLNPERFTASYRVAGEEKLLIKSLGMPIDQRFLVSCMSGYNEGPAFPRNLQLILGVMSMREMATGSPHTACQRTIFNECTQSPYNAYLTFCQYAPLQNPITVPYNVAMQAVFSVWSLMYWDVQQNCHVLNAPCHQPDLYCANERDLGLCECSSSSSSHHIRQRRRQPCAGRNRCRGV